MHNDFPLEKSTISRDPACWFCVAGGRGVATRCRINTHPVIRGLGALSVLGSGVAAHLSACSESTSRFRPLAGLLGNDSPHARLHAAWIDDRRALIHRMWSPASMAARLVAREAASDAGWSAADLRDTALVVGTSRGNAAGWLSPWPGRRPFRTMAVSNTIHNEPASAISIDLGIRGPGHVQASGCSAGLDALGVALMMLAAGKAPRAIVAAVDLPLVPALLDGYTASGLLSGRSRLDPYGPDCDGFIPGEAAAAIAIETTGDAADIRLIDHLGNTDARNPLAIPPDGGRTPDMLEQAAACHGDPAVVIPHATGTAAQARAEKAVFARAFPGAKPSVCLLKPRLGHTLGASGLVETVLFAAFLREGLVPPDMPGITRPPGMGSANPPVPGAYIWKLAHSLGGHNSLLVIQSPPSPHPQTT